MHYAGFKYNSDGGESTSYLNVHPESGPQRTLDCDRSDIRVFEIGLPTQQNGDQFHSSHAEEEAESQRLISIAKSHGLYIHPDEVSLLGELHRVPSGESRIFYDQSHALVYKVRNPWAKRPIKRTQVTDALYEHIIHNLLFPETRYSFVGISEENGDVRFILSQQFFDTIHLATNKQIEEFLLARGLHKEDNYFFGNDYFSITDVSESSDNVFIDNNKQLLFIDPIIRLKRPAIEVIAYLEQNPFVSIKETQKTLWRRLIDMF